MGDAMGLGTVGWGMLWGRRYWDEGCYGVGVVGDSRVVDPMGLEGLGTRCHWGRRAGGLGVGDGTFPAPPLLCLLPSAPHSQRPPSPPSGFSHPPFPLFPIPVSIPPSSHPRFSHSPSPIFPVPVPSATFPTLPPPFPMPPLPPTHMEAICGWFSPFEGLCSPQPHCCVVTAGCGGSGGGLGVSPQPGMGMFPSWAQ